MTVNACAVRLNRDYGASFMAQADEGLRQALSQPYFSTALGGPEEAVWSVAYSPDGEQLATGSADRTVRLWPTTNVLLSIGCSQIRRNLSWQEWQRYLPLEPIYHLTCINLPVHPSLAQAMVAWPEEQQQQQLESLRQQSPAAAEQLEQLLAEEE